jgi:hypothetical protein
MSPKHPRSERTFRAARPRSPRRLATPARDTEASCFAKILDDLIARIPGAYGAVLVDMEGEAVDYTYTGHVKPFDLKLAGAHWQIVLAELSTFSSDRALGTARDLVVRGARRSFIMRVLPESYALIVLLRRRAGFSAIHRAFSVCERALAHEARWDLPEPKRQPTVGVPTAAHAGAQDWFAVEIRTNRLKRPVRLKIEGKSGPQEHDIEVIGSVMGMVPRELGFRVRTTTGLEFTLIREPGGYWYADEDVSTA